MVSRVGGRLEKIREKFCREENVQKKGVKYGFYRPSKEVEASAVEKRGNSEETCLETLEMLRISTFGLSL